MGDLERFYVHSLAERLGVTVAELDERMSSAELIAWVSYDRLKSEMQDEARRNAEHDAKHAAKATKLARGKRGDS